MIDFGVFRSGPDSGLLNQDHHNGAITNCDSQWGRHNWAGNPRFCQKFWGMERSDIHVKNVASPVAVTATGDLTGRALDGGLFGLPFPSVGAPRLEARDGRSTRGR